jgi:hypothetical protein
MTNLGKTLGGMQVIRGVNREADAGILFALSGPGYMGCVLNRGLAESPGVEYFVRQYAFQGTQLG